MLTYKIILKGLKFGEDSFETIELFIHGDSEQHVDTLINEAIYEVRLNNLYYKMKYVSKVLVQ